MRRKKFEKNKKEREIYRYEESGKCRRRGISVNMLCRILKAKGGEGRREKMKWRRENKGEGKLRNRRDDGF